MCAFCIPCASPGPPRQVVPQRIPTARPPIRVTVRAIPKAQHRGVSGLTPLFATLPGNPPVSLIIATLPKSGSRNPFVCHTYETPPGDQTRGMRRVDVPGDDGWGADSLFRVSPACGIIPAHAVAANLDFWREGGCSGRTIDEWRGGGNSPAGVEFDGASGGVSHIHCCRRKPDGIHDSRGDSGGAFWIAVWRGERVCRPARGAHGFRFDSHCGAFNQHPEGVRAVDDPGKQYRADDRLRGRVAGGRRDVHAAGADFSGVRLGIYVLADLPAGAAGRMARRPVHDSAAPAADRKRTWQPDVSRRHGLRRRFGGRGARRLVCRTRVLGAGPGRRLHLHDEHGAGVDRPAGSAPEVVSGSFLSGHYHCRVFGSGLHHRSQGGGNTFCGRRDLLAAGDARDSVFWAARGKYTDLSVHHSHTTDDAGRHVAPVHPADGGGGGGGGWINHTDSHPANDPFRFARRTEGCSRRRRSRREYRQPHRARYADELGRRRFRGDHRAVVRAADGCSGEGHEHHVVSESSRWHPGGYFWISVCHGRFPNQRVAGQFIESGQRHEHWNAYGYVRDFPSGRMDGAELQRSGSDDWRIGVHRCRDCGRNFAGFEDRLPGGRDAGAAAMGPAGWRDGFHLRDRHHARPDEQGT